MKNVPGQSEQTPWHLWLVAVFFILLSVAGAYDYLMLLDLNEAYFDAQNWGNSQITYFTDYPLLPRIFWTINIGSGLVAPTLLLLRSRWAEWLALIYVASQVCLLLITFGFMNRWNMLGPQMATFDILITLMMFGLYLYCRRMSARGTLR